MSTNNQPYPPTLSNNRPLTIADLERLVSSLSLTSDNQLSDDDDYTNVNASRMMYRFWLRTDVESEQVLMQYLNIMKRNRKFQTFIKLALRAAILETARYGDYFEQSDELYVQIAEMLNKIDWSRE